MWFVAPESSTKVDYHHLQKMLKNDSLMDHHYLQKQELASNSDAQHNWKQTFLLVLNQKVDENLQISTVHHQKHLKNSHQTYSNIFEQYGQFYHTVDIKDDYEKIDPHDSCKTQFVPGLTPKLKKKQNKKYNKTKIIKSNVHSPTTKNNRPNKIHGPKQQFLTYCLVLQHTLAVFAESPATVHTR